MLYGFIEIFWKNAARNRDKILSRLWHLNINSWVINFCYKVKEMRVMIIHEHLTFIISRSVLNTMSNMMKYSNGVDTTIRHTLYLKLFRSFGMYRSSGRAPIVKSMQDFCWNNFHNIFSYWEFSVKTSPFWEFPHLIFIDLAIL